MASPAVCVINYISLLALTTLVLFLINRKIRSDNASLVLFVWLIILAALAGVALIGFILISAGLSAGMVSIIVFILIFKISNR